MICPKCKRAFYFLDGRTLNGNAHCVRCKHRGMPQKPSYDDYHQDLYSARSYRRTPQTDPQMRRILARLDIRPGEVVIDIGCGVGDYTQAIKPLTEHAAGYDRDVTAAKKKYPGIGFFAHDLEQPIPLPDASVDKMISINVIEHLVDWNHFLLECRRVLRPGGVIALSTANREFFLHDLNVDPTHYHEWTLNEFTRIVETYFRILDAREDCAMFNYYPLNQILRHFLKPDLTVIARKPF